MIPPSLVVGVGVGSMLVGGVALAPTRPTPFKISSLLTDAPEVSELLTLVEREIEVRRRAEFAAARRVDGMPPGTSLLDHATPAELAEIHRLERGIATAMERCRGLSIGPPRRGVEPR